MAGGKAKVKGTRARTRAPRKERIQVAKSAPPIKRVKKVSSSEEVVKSEETEPEEVVTVQILQDPMRSQRDLKNYRNIMLSNGVRCLLISNCPDMILEQESNEEPKEEVPKEEPKTCDEQKTNDTSVFNRRRGKRRQGLPDESSQQAKRARGEIPDCATDGAPQQSFFSKVGSTASYLAQNLKRNLLLSTNESTEDNDDETNTGWGLPDEAQFKNDTVNEEETCKTAKKCCTRARFVLNFASGSMNDPPEAQGLAHVTMRRSLDWLNEVFQRRYGITYGSVHSEDTNIGIRFFVWEQEDGQLLSTFTKGLHKFFDRKAEPRLQEIVDRMDSTHEYRQCYKKWRNPMKDSRRLTLLVSLAEEKHPVRIMSKGDPMKLAALLNKGKTNGKESSRLSQLMAQFSKSHYISSGMTITLEAPETLDVLQEMVLRAFSHFPESEIPEITGEENPFETEEFRKFYTVKCTHRYCVTNRVSNEFLVISWGLPPKFWKAYEVKPLDYIGAIISDERQGGLSYLLQQRNLAVYVHAGCTHDGAHRNEFYSLFEITVKLREEGLKQVDQVIEAVFSYLRFLINNGPFKAFYNELRKIRLIHFDATARDYDVAFGGYRRPRFDLHAAASLRYYDPKDVKAAPHLFHHFDEGLIQSCTEMLKADTANYMLCVNEPASEDDEIEPILKTRYNVKDVSDEQRTMWENVKAYSEFLPPKPNEFISTNFCRRKHEKGSKEIILYNPGESCNYRIWYHYDLAPNNYCLYHIHLASPVAFSSPENAAMLKIWFRMLRKILDPIVYEMSAADIRVQMKSTRFGIILNVYSWNNKIVEALKAIIVRMINFQEVATITLFEMAKNDALNSLVSSLSSYYGNYYSFKDVYESLTVIDHWTIPEMIYETKLVNFQDIMKFAQEFNSNICIAAMIRGNIGVDNAQELSTVIQENLIPKSLNLLTRVRMFQLPHGEHIIRYKSINPKQTFDTVQNYYQIGRASTKLRVIARFAMQCFYDAQSRSYLKYIDAEYRRAEKSKLKNKNSNRAPNWLYLEPYVIDMRGIMTVVVGDGQMDLSYEYGDCDVDDINEFIQEGMDTIYTDVIQNMKPKEFNRLKETFKPKPNNNYEPPLVDIYLDYGFFWDSYNLQSPMEDLTFRFDEKSCGLDAWEKLTLEEVKEFWRIHFTPRSSEFRKVSCQILRAIDPDDDAAEESAFDIQPRKYETWAERRERRRTDQSCIEDSFDLETVTRPKPNTQEIVYKFETDGDGEEPQENCNEKFITDPSSFTLKLFKFPMALDLSSK